MMAHFPLLGGNNIWGLGGHGLIGDWRVLFVFGWAPPFAIFFMKQTFDRLPDEWRDAAKLDGAGRLTIIFRVYGPLLKPALTVVAVITFVNTWNDYLWPAVTLSNSLEFVPITMRIDAMLGGSAGRPLGSNPALAIMRPCGRRVWCSSGCSAISSKGGRRLRRRGRTKVDEPLTLRGQRC